MRKKAERKKAPLRLMILGASLAVTLPIVGLLILNSMASYRNIREEKLVSYQTALLSSSRTIGAARRSFNDYLVNFVSASPEYTLLISTKSHSEYVAQKYNLYRQSLQLANPVVGSMFIYTSARGEFFDYTFQETVLSHKLALRDLLTEKLSQALEERAVFPRWSVVTVEGHAYLVEVLQSQDGCLGGWFDMDSIFASLPQPDADEAYVLCLGDERLYGTGELWDRVSTEPSTAASWKSLLKDPHLLTVETSLMEPELSLMALASESVLQAYIIDTQTTTGLLLALVALLTALLFFLLENTVGAPIRNFVKAMDAARFVGRSHVELQGFQSREMVGLYTHFNNMMDQMDQMETRMRQEQRDRITAEYNYLRSQINPHFFMNLLNTLHALTITQETDETLEVIQFMADYYRYMLKKKAALVPLQEELEHIENYLNIQKIRFPDHLTWEMHTQEEAMLCKIPILSLQTLVENVMEHAFDGVHNIHVAISALRTDDTSVKIQVVDTGPGFSESVLETINKAGPVTAKDSARIGLVNVKRRIHLIYGEQGSLVLCNTEQGGAKAVMSLPAKPPEEVEFYA